ncbi:acyl-CoA dehydrogenase family protein [Brevibacterium yomogidense]|uniref:acyl-CoA dehydrogenase family protein n=1 Tax=Brevibacterium yomogidense TaxID=946573 RepID=UPI0018DF25E2|nr:acyl-CoA dehydrogenase family protein [Brevibacterium yomogidense]
MTATTTDHASTVWESDELTALRETTTRFVRTEILPHQDDWERKGMLPRSLHRTAGDLGLLGASFPEEVGGGGGGPLAAVTMAESMFEAGASGGTHASLFTSGIALPHIIAGGDQDQIDRWVKPTLAGELIGSLGITEPSGGSDVGRLRTRAVVDPDDDTHYRVTGEKTYITSGVRADFVTTAVRTGGPGSAGISLLVVEKGTPGFEVAKKLEKLGWHASDTAELVYDDVRVPRSNLVGVEGGGFALISQAFVSERLGLAVNAYSSAQRALDLALQWCRDRETFGKPLIARDTIQQTLTTMAMRIDVARTYTRRLAERCANGETDVVAHACFAKNTAVETASWVVDQSLQLFGGLGYMHETEISRLYRDVRIMGIGGGTVEILNRLAAKHLGYLS